MKFILLRVLTHSELGMFHEYRRQGKEGSKQRAINFDADVVDRVFPAAADTDRVPLSLAYDTDNGVQVKAHWLTRQAKNWRFEGNCPQDRLYGFVEPGCLFAMEVESGRTIASGAWVVFPKDHEVTKAVLSEGAAAGLTRAGMIALHGDEAIAIRAALTRFRPDTFTPPETLAAEAEAVPGTAAADAATGKRLPPRPERLVDIIGGTGHSLLSAVADIVDNSISADATEIDITFGPPNGGNGRWLSVRDNGVGMSEDELAEAMTLGSLVTYDENSLGKFGYGLKGASWSQARVFTVVSRKRGHEACHLTWDKENLGDWVATNAPLEPWEAEATRLGDAGTAVLWKDMKPPAAVAAIPGAPPHTAEVTHLWRHLGLVFHRFLEGKATNRKKVTLRINGAEVEPNNPVGHTLTKAYDAKTIRVTTETGNEPVVAQAFVAPHEDELKEHHRGEGASAIHDALQRSSLYGRRNESQGLFVYRNDRLIAWGGWHQMWSTSDEKTKLARVVVSFGSKLDRPFDINITKRSVSLPPYVQEEIKKLATPARKASQAKYVRKPPATTTTTTTTTTTGSGTGTGSSTTGATSSPGPAVSGGSSETGAPSGSGSSTGVGEGSGPTPRPAINLRPVTTSVFAWKIAQNLTGGRDLQVSGRLPELQALAKRLEGNAEAVADLAAFLSLLDAGGLQERLLQADAET